MERLRNIIVTSDASGAKKAAQTGMLVIIVDVIDMSTTLESALDAGAAYVLGASPDYTNAPVSVNPYAVGLYAGNLAQEKGSKIIIVSEPRVGTDEERARRCQKVIKGIEVNKGIIESIVPNIGAEVVKITDFKDKIVIAVTDTGGVAFDAAFMENRQVITATVARTYRQKGVEPAITGVKRVFDTIKPSDTGIAVVAASQNSLEDVLAAQYIANLIINYRSLSV